MKAKQAAESERSEAASALEDATKARAEAEDRASSLLRERSQLQSQLDENEEELADVSISPQHFYSNRIQKSFHL